MVSSISSRARSQVADDLDGAEDLAHVRTAAHGPIERITLPLVRHDTRHVGQSGNVVEPLHPGQAGG